MDPTFHDFILGRLSGWCTIAGMNSLLTQDETAELLRLTQRQLNRLARDGDIPSIALPNGQLRFESNAIQDWVDGLRRPAPSASLSAR
jgi:hypothetical protein